MYFSTSPHIGVGYGVTTRELVKRMQADGHEVRVATKHSIGGQLIVDGIECMDGTEPEVINEVLSRDNYDYILSINDSWAFSAYNAAKAFTKSKWAMAMFLDTEWIHYHMINIAKESSFQLAVTKHGEKELKRVGFYPYYTPLGVDTNVFKPDPELRAQFRKKKGWTDDKFVIGFVGINYPTDRKNTINLIKAFQKFYKEFPDSELYLHTDTIGSASNGSSLQWILGSCGFEPNGMGPVKIVDQVDYHLWNISRDELVGLYNAFDTFCFPTHGEGFGLPIVEAQSCGCPVITTDTTSGKELLKGGLLIPVVEDDYVFSSLRTWVARVPATRIYDRMKIMYKIWKAGKLGKYQKKAREGMLEYDWNNVYDTYWRPFLKDLENKLDLSKIQTEQCPDWGYLHRQMIGRIMFAGKFNCDYKGCKDICAWEFPRLHREPFNERSILSRSYPIFPNKDGDLVVDIKCRFSGWLPPRFIDEIRILWEELWTYPRIRDEVKYLWDLGYFSKGNFKLLSDIKQEFDDSYSEVMQTCYETQFHITDEILNTFKNENCLTVLDAGCGQGVRIKTLNETGFKAIGTEVNKKWIDDKLIFYGDINNLPYSDNSFDVVMTVDVLEHVKDPLPALKELFRVTKKYAIIEVTSSSDGSIMEDATHCTRWSPPAWEREISEFGTIVKRITGQSWLVKKK